MCRTTSCHPLEQKSGVLPCPVCALEGAELNPLPLGPQNSTTLLFRLFGIFVSLASSGAEVRAGINPGHL